MPRGVPKNRNPIGAGAELAKQAKIVGTKHTGLENDPAILAARKADIEDEKELDNPESSVDIANQALELIGTELRKHPIGNGITVPYPKEEDPTTEYSTCSKPIKDTNRGCNWARICPLVGKGPYNIPYLNKKTGLVKTCFCTTMASAYLAIPYIQILPGVDFLPTRSARYKPLANGQEPVPGPGQPRTPIELRPHKTKLTCVIPEDLAVEYQRKRRNGDFLKG